MMRDRRTVINMLVIPLAIFPIIINLTAFFSGSVANEAANKKLKIGVILNRNSPLSEDLQKMPKELGPYEISYYKDKVLLIEDVKKDSIQLAGFFSSSNISTDSMRPIQCLLYFNGADAGVEERAKAYMQTVEQKAQERILQKLGIDEAIIKPLNTHYINIASEKEMLGKMAGGFLPYIIISACFAGCFIPAIDLFSGEKERGTLETLLTSPVLRWHILFGKMGVIITAGLIAAACSLTGLYLSMQFLNIMIDQDILTVVNKVLSVHFILMLFCLLFPLVIFITGIMVPLAIYAKSYKEAQSLIGPLNIVLMVPAFIGLFPGFELNAMTACIPIVNIVLATKDLIAGTLNIGYIAICFGVMSCLALFAVLLSYRQFGKESNIIL